MLIIVDGGGPGQIKALLSRRSGPPARRGYEYRNDYAYDDPSEMMDFNNYARQSAMTTFNASEAENQGITMQAERGLTAMNQLATMTDHHEERVGLQQQGLMDIMQQSQDVHYAGQRAHEARQQEQHADGVRALNEQSHVCLIIWPRSNVKPIGMPKPKPRLMKRPCAWRQRTMI